MAAESVAFPPFSSYLSGDEWGMEASVATRVVALVIALWCGLGSTGCASFETWLKAHGDAGAWGRAASPLNPQHSGSLALLASTIYLGDRDDRISRSLAPDKPFAGDDGAEAGDRVLAVLASGPLIAVGVSAIAPQHSGEAWEVLQIAVETFVITGGLVEGLKRAVRRERPDNNSGLGGRFDNVSTKSFPSGHVAGAMAASALTGRWLRTRHRSLIAVEAAMYIGVLFVGITRIENDKHFPTDVVAGAIIGGYVANTVWDAHYGVDGKGGILDHLRRHLVPVPVDDGGGLILSYPF